MGEGGGGGEDVGHVVESVSCSFHNLVQGMINANLSRPAVWAEKLVK